MRFTATLVALAGLGIVPANAQQGDKPAPVIEILREAIKEGRSAAHEKVESEYAATFRKANFPAHYIALNAMSGTSEVWFIQPMKSFAQYEEFDKLQSKEPLKSATAMLDSRDGELRSSSRTMWAVHRPDLSYGEERFNPGKTRYVAAGIFRVRMGREEDFTELAKTYVGTLQKANTEGCTLAYQVTAGAPAGTYLFFTMMDGLGYMDSAPARMKAMQDVMGADGMSRFMKSAGDSIASIEEMMFQVKPGMSYVPQNMVDTDPDFWKPKPAMMPKTAAAAEKKAGQ